MDLAFDPIRHKKIDVDRTTIHNVLLYFVIYASLCKQLLRRRKNKQSHLQKDGVNEVEEEEQIDFFFVMSRLLPKCRAGAQASSMI